MKLIYTNLFCFKSVSPKQVSPVMLFKQKKKKITNDTFLGEIDLNQSKYIVKTRLISICPKS